MFRQCKALATFLLVGITGILCVSSVQGQIAIELKAPERDFGDVLCYGNQKEKYFAATKLGIWEFDKFGDVAKRNPNSISAAAFNPQKGEFIIKGSEEHLFAFSTVDQSSTKLPIASDYSPLKITDNGKFLVAKRYDGNIQIFETEKWNALLKNDLMADRHAEVELSADGSFVVIAYSRRRNSDLVEIFDVTSGQTISKSAGLITSVTSIKLLSDQKLAILGTSKGKTGISVFDTKTLRDEKFLFASGGRSLFGLGPQGLLGLSADRGFIAFDAYSGEKLVTIETQDSTFGRDYAVLGTNQIISGFRRPIVLEWGSSRNFISPIKTISAFSALTSRMDKKHRMDGHDNIELAWHPAGKTIAVSTPFEGKSSGGNSIAASVINSTRDSIADGVHDYGQPSKANLARYPTIRFINYETGKQVSQYSPAGETTAFSELKFSRSGKSFACRSGKYDFVFFNLAEKRTRQISFKNSPTCRDFCFEFEKDEQSVLVLSRSNLQRRNLNSGAGELISENVKGQSIHLIDENQALCGSKIIDLTTGESKADFRQHRSVSRVANKQFVVNSIDDGGDLARWDLETLEKRRFLAGEFRGFTVDSDGSMVAAGYANGTIKVWDVTSRRLIGILRGHKRSVDDLAFHPSKPILASVSRTGTMHFWKLENNLQSQTETSKLKDLPSHFQFDLGNDGSLEAHFPTETSRAELIHAFEELLGKLKK